MSPMHAREQEPRFCNDNHRSFWDLLIGHFGERGTRRVLIVLTFIVFQAEEEGVLFTPYK